MNDERAGKNGGILWKRWRKYAAEAMRMRLRHIGGGSRILLQKGRLCRDEKDAALLLSNREGYEAADEIFMRERIETV